MSETLGDLVDKLTIANLKVWHLQDQLYAYSKMGEEEFRQVSPADLHGFLKKLATTNLTRTSLIGEIDTLFGEALRTGVAPKDAKVKLA